MDEEKIISACKKGDRQAQELLYQTYYRKMYGLCLYYSTNSSEAMDHLQDGFVHLFKKIGKYGAKGSFEGWMRRMFVNLILQKYRSKKLLFTTGHTQVNENQISYEHILEDISAGDLLKIINELSPQYRLVFNLYALEGYSHKEIAEKLNISEGTSKSNLSRARSLLQEKIKVLYPGIYETKSNEG